MSFKTIRIQFKKDSDNELMRSEKVLLNCFNIKLTSIFPIILLDIKVVNGINAYHCLGIWAHEINQYLLV